MNETLCDRYQILNPLGSGGFGETFLAIDLHSPTQRKVVVKALKSVHHNTSSEIIEKLFLREAQVLEELGQNCPQIPTLYAYFCQDEKYYLVQEYIEGKNLSQSGILSSERCFALLTSLLETLKYVHSRNIIHRDIKPENIIIRDSDGLPVLIDFGAVKETLGSFTTSSGSTASSVVIGTKGFIAPEQSTGRTVFSTDLFALGLTMIYSLTGKYPIELPSNNITGELEWQNLVANLHPFLAKVLEKAIKMDIPSRYLTSEAMLKDLQTRENVAPSTVNLVKDNANTSPQAPTVIISTTPVTNSQHPVTPPPPSPPPSPVSQPIYYPATVNQPEKEKSSNLVVILLVLLVALFGSLAGFFIIQNINQTQQKIAEIEQEKEEIKLQLVEENKQKEELEKKFETILENNRRQNNVKKEETQKPNVSKQFERLKRFTKQQEWVKAELELDLLQPQYLTCSQLSEIDQIYSGYSHGSFGYGVQRYLWDSKEINRNYSKFVELVGWKQEENYVYNINDSKMLTGKDAAGKANLGHLPFHGWQVKGKIRKDFEKFMDKLRKCNI